MRAWSLVVIAAFLFAGRPAPAGPASTPPIVTAGDEKLRGVWLAPDEAVFRGIPYAAPPVGDLRWRPPAPHRPRPGTQSAEAFGPVCTQTDRLQLWVKGIVEAFGTQNRLDTPALRTSEDCLFVNVWTTRLGAETPAPVMVWIHGGSNVNGEGSSPWTEGHALARQGVVVVTINYRLGVFGFLAHPGLSAESPDRVSGNYGLLDQLEALRWVKANIRAFGGDPDRVTVFGESAGSIDLLTLMASPASKGLFHRAIAQSGVPLFAAHRLAEAEAQGIAFAREVGAETVGALRQTPAEQILSRMDRLRLEGQLKLEPVVDGWLLPDVPGRVFAAGKQTIVPLMVGSNAREMTTLRQLLPRFERTVPEYRKWLTTFGPAAPRLEELYPASRDEEVDATVVGAMTDFGFTCPSRFAARALEKAGGAAFLYHFTRIPPGGEKLGAYHGLEITYAFGNRLAWLPREAADDRLSTAMPRYWAAFATNGQPSVEGLPEWPRYDASASRYLELGTVIDAKQGLKQEACDLLDRVYPFLWGPAR